MIKILSSNTTFSIQTGRKPVRTRSVKGRFGEGVSKYIFSAEPVEFTGLWTPVSLEGILSASSDVYVGKVSLSFQFRSSRPVRETAVWAEASPLFPGRKAGKQLPGTMSLKAARESDGFIWVSEAEGAEGVCFYQKPPSVYPVHFVCRPGAGLFRVEWLLNRMVKAGEEIALSVVNTGRGGCTEWVEKWRREWRGISTRPPSAECRSVWMDSGIVTSPKDLRETLVSLRREHIALDCFMLSPRYAEEMGDWLFPSEPFQDRMGSVSRAISDYHLVPGLRFAPFLASSKSVLAARKREWFIKSPNGNPVTAASYDGVRGSVWVLDITREDVRRYITKVLSTVRNQWGFRAFVFERLGDAALPGIRENEELGPGKICDMASDLLREALGNRVFIAASGMPAQISPGLWDARFIMPDSLGKRHKHQDSASLLLHQASWDGGSWINAAGPLPLSLFENNASPAAESLLTAAALSSGVVFFTGAPDSLGNNGRERLKSFSELFELCKGQRVKKVESAGGGALRPLVIYCRSGHMGIFNFSGKKQSMILGSDSLKGGPGYSGKIAIGKETVFNSPEIHVVLPPGGHRIFRK